MFEAIPIAKVSNARQRAMKPERYRWLALLHREFVRPATSWEQFKRQRVVAVILGFILAMLL